MWPLGHLEPYDLHKILTAFSKCESLADADKILDESGRLRSPLEKSTGFINGSNTYEIIRNILERDIQLIGLDQQETLVTLKGKVEKWEKPDSGESEKTDTIGKSSPYMRENNYH